MKKRNPSSDFVREFTESMPRDYLQQHTHEEVVRHARVAAARRSELVRVEVDSGEHHTGNVYFVADDRAGLLARASSALAPRLSGWSMRARRPRRPRTAKRRKRRGWR